MVVTEEVLEKLSDSVNDNDNAYDECIRALERAIDELNLDISLEDVCVVLHVVSITEDN